MAILSSGLLSQISFDCRGFQDSGNTLVTAPEAASTIETATHGFKKVKAPDGTDAIEVKITRPNGREVTWLLSEGAIGVRYVKLADYGREKLAGATLLSRDDFEAVVDSLLKAIKGQRPVNGVLQTEDEALNQAYKIVTQGVRRDGGFSWAVFDLDDTGAVAGRRLNAYGRSRFDLGYRCVCALFGASPAESK